MSSSPRLVGIVATVLLAACQRESPDPPERAEVMSAGPATPSASVRASPSSSAAPRGTIAGIVRFRGTAPPARRLPINKDQSACGQGEREVRSVDVGEDGRLSGAVVFVDEVLSALLAPPAPVLRQSGCAFTPQIIVAPLGSNLMIVNDDPVSHNIHGYDYSGTLRRSAFSFTQPSGGPERSTPIAPRKGRLVELRCDIHEFMRGWVFAAPSAWAVVTAEGAFELTGVPAGRRRLAVFHPELGEQGTTVEVTDGERASQDFEYPQK